MPLRGKDPVSTWKIGDLGNDANQTAFTVAPRSRQASNSAPTGPRGREGLLPLRGLSALGSD